MEEMGLQHFAAAPLKCQSQLHLHFTRQTELIIRSEKKNSKNPVIIAPAMLVAAKDMPSSTNEVKTVPKIPTKNVVRFLQQNFRSE